jgi:hypothetical protein
VINAGGEGIFFGEGIEQMPLSDALPAPVDLRPLDAVVRVPPSAQPPAVVAARVREVRRGVTRQPAPPPLDRWRDFVGDAFNIDAVGASLDRAERTLEHRAAGRAEERATTPWPDLSASDTSRRVLIELPEAMARLRTALGGGLPPSAPDPEPTTRESQLADAAALLGRIASPSVRSG